MYERSRTVQAQSKHKAHVASEQQLKKKQEQKRLNESCMITSNPVMSQYFLAGYIDGGASMLASVKERQGNTGASFDDQSEYLHLHKQLFTSSIHTKKLIDCSTFSYTIMIGQIWAPQLSPIRDDRKLKLMRKIKALQ